MHAVALAESDGLLGIGPTGDNILLIAAAVCLIVCVVATYRRKRRRS